MSFWNKLKWLLGTDNEWEKQFDVETDTRIEQKRDELAGRGMLTGGIGKREVGLLKLKIAQEKRDTKRNRIIKGLAVISIIEATFALIISILALILK